MVDTNNNKYNELETFNAHDLISIAKDLEVEKAQVQAAIIKKAILKHYEQHLTTENLNDVPKYVRIDSLGDINNFLPSNITILKRNGFRVWILYIWSKGGNPYSGPGVWKYVSWGADMEKVIEGIIKGLTDQVLKYEYKEL